MKVTIRDIISPATLLTASGLLFVIAGSIRLHSLTGLELVVLGRFMDLLDGPAARATRATRFGAAFDASADKLSLAAILAAAFYFHMAPPVVLAYIALHNLLNAAAAIRAEHRGKQPHTAISGKLCMFLENIALFAYFLAALYPQHTAWGTTGLVLFILSLPVGWFATRHYVRHGAGSLA